MLHAYTLFCRLAIFQGITARGVVFLVVMVVVLLEPSQPL